MRLTPAVLIVSALTATLAAAPQQRQSRSRQVVITALERDGTTAKALTTRDLAVREDGAAREVLQVAQATDPMHIALLVDTSAATEAMVQDLRKGLEAFARAIYAKSSRSQIALITFGERPTQEADYTSTFSTLQRGIQRVFPRAGSGAYLLEAINDAAKGLKKREAARPVIVAFSNEGGPEFSNLTHQQIAEIVKASRAQLWVVDLQGRSDDSVEARNRAVVVSDVAMQSGGTREPLLSAMGIAPKFAELAERLLTQYAVTYSRPDSLIPPDKLEVTATREGLRLLAPRWTGQ